MVSAIKYRFRDGEIEAELSMSVEGVPLMENVKELKLSVVEDVREMRLFENQFEIDEPVEEVESEQEDSGKIKPKLEVKPIINNVDIDQKLENKLRNDVMVG